MKLFISGRTQSFNILKHSISKDDTVIWFHVASLGEYEQAVPVINYFKTNAAKYKILLSFFSPSGYEVKKHNSLADVVVYLPLDTKKQARKFIEMANPKYAIFIKYEIWPNYLNALQHKNISTLLISGLFRDSQIYFKWYGSFMKRALSTFEHIFVQTEASKLLLNSINFGNVTVSGDTRFDRVLQQLSYNNTLDFIAEFKDNSICIVCGSTWPEDDAILIDYINTVTISNDISVKFIIAPHQIKPDYISTLKYKLKDSICFSEKEGKHLSGFKVLIVDTIGLLTKIYSYADIAYVGGAMGTSGLHNILEPATFGVPIVIGKNFTNFPEASALQNLGGLCSVKSSAELSKTLDRLINDTILRTETGTIAKTYITTNAGATQSVSRYLDTLITQ